jgi:hypothetical protein
LGICSSPAPEGGSGGDIPTSGGKKGGGGRPDAGTQMFDGGPIPESPPIAR